MANHWHSRLRLHLCSSAFICGSLILALSHQASGQSAPRLLLAFASFKDRPLHPQTYFYEHDGVGEGQLVGGVEATGARVDTHPTLARGGKLCACASELENNPSDTRLWDRTAKQDVSGLEGLNTEGTEVGAALSADGQWVAFAAWNRPGAAAGWNLFLYNLNDRKTAELPLNTDDDELSPSLSEDGRLVAFVSNRAGGAGLVDIYLFDRQSRKLRPLPGLNSSRRELDPALSADGRWLAFTSDRPGGTGARDVYLYDLNAEKRVPLPGLNGIGIDQTPALSPDGRYLAFVAERASGAGERDIYLYDRQGARLVPTPGLNTRTEEFDPALIYRAD